MTTEETTSVKTVDELIRALEANQKERIILAHRILGNEAVLGSDKRLLAAYDENIKGLESALEKIKALQS